MTIRLFGCVCGQFHSPAAGMGMAGEGRVAAPVPFYVIEHPDGVALFDCGLHSDLEDPNHFYRKALQAQDLDVTFGGEDTVTRHLERLDIDPGRVRWIVLSHLHFDHAGGLHQVPNASLVVQKREWAAGFDDDIGRRYFLFRNFFDLGHPVRQVEGEFDLFGDGSVVTIPSFGHTPGHQSLRVRSGQGEHILVGDACYNCQVVETRSFPDYSDHAAMNQSLDRLLGLRGADTVMVYGHDPDQWGANPVLPSLRT